LRQEPVQLANAGRLAAPRCPEFVQPLAFIDEDFLGPAVEAS